MGLVADSGGIYALYDSDDHYHRTVVQAIDNNPGPIIIPMAILAEIDYLLRAHLGIDSELDFLDGILTGAYTLEPLRDTDLDRCRDLVLKYRDLDVGLADAAVVATAERLGINRILTVDERHFRAFRSKRGRPFTLLPADTTT